MQWLIKNADVVPGFAIAAAICFVLIGVLATALGFENVGDVFMVLVLVMGGISALFMVLIG